MNYNFNLDPSSKEILLNLDIKYKKYNDLYILKTSYMYSDFISRLPVTFKIPIFGLGKTIDQAEINLIKNIKNLDIEDSDKSFLKYLENKCIFEFNINIENFDEENSDFHMSLSTSEKKIHISGNDFETNITNLYKKYTILK